METAPKGRSVSANVPPTGTYWLNSKRPLEILVFLLPFIIAYEFGLVGVLRAGDGQVLTNVAHKTIVTTFEFLGVSGVGFALPGIILVVILLVWHFLRRAPWSIDYSTVGIMWLESLVLVLPVLLMAQMLTGAQGYVALADSEVAAPGLMGQIAVGIGAGLYEELVFRWLLIAVLHTLACDVFKLRHSTGLILSIILAAFAFAWYHPFEGNSYSLFTFYFLGGVYFGGIFVVRGFGIVAAVHALYDVVVVLGNQ